MVEHSDLLLLDNCGHFSTLERPTEVSQALCNWYLESSRARP
jgi:pimeloyl-ACP methyl ester carboxylesterase